MLGDLTQVLVAGMVAVAVVDVLELVEIDEQQRAGPAVGLARGIDVHLEHFLEAAAVDQPGQ